MNTVPPDFIVLTLYRPFSNQQRRIRKRDTCIRVMVAVILLGIVFGFILYEWNCYWPGVEERQDLSHHQEPNKTHKTSEDEDHEHHEHGKDDDHDKDHNHKDNHNHTHGHSPHLYHNAAIITDSGMTPFINNYNTNVCYDRKFINIFQNKF